MTEVERIQSIKNNGGRHLQNFKEHNITYAMCLTAVELDGKEFISELAETFPGSKNYVERLLR